MGTADLPQDEIQQYAEELAATNVGEEGAPAPEPQGEIPLEEGAVETEETAVVDEGGEEETFEVTVDGTPQQVSHQELVDGYMRRDSFTKKSQALARERESFQAERAAMAAGRSPGLGTPPGAGYDPWGFSAAAPVVSEPMYGGPEQAAPGTTAGAPAAQPFAADEGDVVTRAELLNFRQQIAADNQQMAARNQAILDGIRKQQAEQAAMERLSTRYAGFNEQACMETYYRLPYDEQERLRAMPRSVALELIHLQNPGKAPAASQAKREPKPPKVPYSEPSRNVPREGTSSAAAQEAPPMSNRQGMGEWWQQQIAADKARPR